MLLPTKHIPLKGSLLAAGKTILELLRSPQTVTRLWMKAQKHPTIGTFDRFCLALDFLYVLGVISFENGFIIRSRT